MLKPNPCRASRRPKRLMLDCWIQHRFDGSGGGAPRPGTLRRFGVQCFDARNALPTPKSEACSDTTRQAPSSNPASHNAVSLHPTELKRGSQAASFGKKAFESFLEKQGASRHKPPNKVPEAHVPKLHAIHLGLPL